MANPEQLEYLQDSADDWNIYRREHTIARPELMGADLSAAQLPGADLSGADLSGADLRAIDLTGANLAHADLIGANLSDAFLLNVERKMSNKVRSLFHASSNAFLHALHVLSCKKLQW